MTTHKFAYYRLAMETEAAVIPALMDALAAAREASQKELRHLRALTTTSERQLRRYENKEHFPPGADIDDLVAIYAEATGNSVFDLWNKAIKEARKAGATKTTPSRAQRQAELNAEKHEAELESELAAESRQSRPNGQRSSKSKRGSGSQ